MTNEPEYHIGLTAAEGARYALLTGDPGRVERIARLLDDPQPVACRREFNTWSGSLEGERVLVTSTGIGGPSAAIAAEELSHIGADTLIRVGTCGGMCRAVAPGDVVIASAAVRQEGTSREYLPIEFPAVAAFAVTQALAAAARRLELPAFVGVVHCKDSFYGQHRPESMPVSGELKAKWDAWIGGGCLASEMESAALFIVGAVRGLRTGAVLHCVWNQETTGGMESETRSSDPADAIRTAVEGMRGIILTDRLDTGY